VQSDDPRSWVTTSKTGAIQALVWDYSPVVPPDGQTDQVFYKNELPTVAKGTLKLDLSGVKNGTYMLDIYQVGYKQNDPFSAYVEMGAPKQLTKAQVASLNALSSGAPMFSGTVSVSNGHFTRAVPLRANDCFEFVLTPVKGKS